MPKQNFTTEAWGSISVRRTHPVLRSDQREKQVTIVKHIDHQKVKNSCIFLPVSMLRATSQFRQKSS